MQLPQVSRQVEPSAQYCFDQGLCGTGVGRVIERLAEEMRRDVGEQRGDVEYGLERMISFMGHIKGRVGEQVQGIHSLWPFDPDSLGA